MALNCRCSARGLSFSMYPRPRLRVCVVIVVDWTEEAVESERAREVSGAVESERASEVPMELDGAEV